MRWLLASKTAARLSSKTAERTVVLIESGSSKALANSKTNDRIGIKVRIEWLKLVYSDSSVDKEISDCRNERQTRGILPKKMIYPVREQALEDDGSNSCVVNVEN